MPTFGENLRREREARNLSQSELARRANLTSQAINMLERRKNGPRMSTVLALAAALDCKPEELYGPAPTKAVA
jgi:transcriptional regulator with XRE-family HTH domain